jgi:hypothetical protein
VEGGAMSMTWLKLHHEVISDVKLRKFNPQEKWAWIVLLVLASDSSDRGVVKNDDEDIADACGFGTIQDWLYYRDKLIVKGFVELTERGLAVVNWEKRQYVKPSDKPDATKERKRKQRAKSSESAESMSRDVTRKSRASHATDTDTDPDPDPDPEISPDRADTEKSAHAEKVLSEQDPETSTSLNSNNTPPSKHSTSGEEEDTAPACSTILDKNKTIWGNKRTKVSQEDRARISCDMVWLIVGIQSMRWKDEEDYRAFAGYIREHARQCNSGEKKDFKPVGNIPAFVSTVLKATAQAEFHDFKSLKLWKDWNSEIAPPPLFVATDEPKLEPISSESMAKFEALREANRLRKEREELVQSRYERRDECAA